MDLFAILKFLHEIQNFSQFQFCNLLGSSPPSLCPLGRTDDLTIICTAIHHANHFIYIAVPDYAPFNAFGGASRPWTRIDDALRKAVKRGVQLRMILSERAYNYKHRKEHLLSLVKLNKHGQDAVQIKVYQVRTSYAVFKSVKLNGVP